MTEKEQTENQDFYYGEDFYYVTDGDKEFKLCFTRANAEKFYFDTDNFKDLELSLKKVLIYRHFLNSKELAYFDYSLPLSNQKKVEELKAATSYQDIYELLDSGQLANPNVCFNYQLYNFIYNDLDDSGLPNDFDDLRLPRDLYGLFTISKTTKHLSPMISHIIVNNLKSYQLTALQKVMHSLDDISNHLDKVFNVLNTLDYFFTHFDDYSCDNWTSPFSMFLPDEHDSDDDEDELPF